MADRGFTVLCVRDVPVDDDVLREAAVDFQLPIRQWIFAAPQPCPEPVALDRLVEQALLHIEAIGYTAPALAGLYPLSLSARTQVLKGRLSSPEVIDYFLDLADPDHRVHTLFFHTRFSTNTDPHPTMAQRSGSSRTTANSTPTKRTASPRSPLPRQPDGPSCVHPASPTPAASTRPWPLG